MVSVLMTVYVLMWPVIVAAVLLVIASGFYKDWKEARAKGVMLV